MTADHLNNIEQFDSDLWKMADSLRANSGLASNEYFMPIMGLLFLRQATNRYYEALSAIQADKAAGKIPDRPFGRWRLPAPSSHDAARRYAVRRDLGAVQEREPGPGDHDLAMEAVEKHFPPLAGQLPKDYERFEDELLENMMRKFDTEALRKSLG